MYSSRSSHLGMGISLFFFLFLAASRQGEEMAISAGVCSARFLLVDCMAWISKGRKPNSNYLYVYVPDVC